MPKLKEESYVYAAREVGARPMLGGYLDADVAREYRFFRQAWDPFFGEAWDRERWDEALGEERIEMIGIRIPLPVTRQQVFKIAQVECYEPALRLLARLYDEVMLPASSLAKDQNGNVAIAIGMLAAAGLCDVSPAGVRLSPEGKDFVELLAGTEYSVLTEE